MLLRHDLTPGEFASLRGVVNGQMSRNIPKQHRARLVELKLIQDMMGVLLPTPEGRIVMRKLG
jgi:hypothetical protein